MIYGFGLSADATARIRRGPVAAPTARATLRALAAALVLVAFGFAQMRPAQANTLTLASAALGQGRFSVPSNIAARARPPPLGRGALMF